MRDDLDAPVLVVQTETEVLGILNYLPARQPDGERFRLWEVAGTAHADRYLLGEVESRLGCPTPINRGQVHAVLKAALRHLDTWAGGGAAPPEAPRLEVDETGDRPAFVRDVDGNVRGGIRTPAVDVAVDVLSGLPAEGSSVICLLMGSTAPIPAARLAERYGTADAYVAAYEEAADATIEAGFALPEDRRALLEDAAPERISG